MRSRIKLGRSFRAALVATALVFPAARAAEPGLTPADSAQLQALLQVQSRAQRVVFANHQPPRAPTDTFDRLFMWNEVALDTTAIDHTPLQPGEIRTFGEQYGPTRSSRGMAITHIAMFEAENAFTRRYESYAHVAPARGDGSIDSAIATAAHDALVYLYPSQKERLDAILAVDLARVPGKDFEVKAGEKVGARAAQAIIDLRKDDGAQVPDPSAGGSFHPIGGVGHWSIDPVSKLQLYLGAYWGQLKPFTLASGSQFRPPPPPALTDPAYTKAFRQALIKGGDPRFGTPTGRTKAQTIEGIYWSYDGTPALCAPPRLYNQVARALVLQHGMNTVAEAGRMLAMINTAMADAAIAAWDAKWTYQFWRPVTAIRSKDQGGNTQVTPDRNWYPLGGQATNTRGPNFTPPFPAYISGHATIGGALFQILRHYYPENTHFTFTSDEWNGMNTDVSGNLRPVHSLTFDNLSDPEYQNAESRIFLGVHWQFDADQGIATGHKVADWAWDHAFRPVRSE